MSQFATTVENKNGFNEVVLHPEHRFIQNFGILNLTENSSFSHETKDCEYALSILEGSCSIEVEGKVFQNIKSRENLFQGLPAALYIPAYSKFTVRKGNAKIAVCSGKCSKKKEPVLITQENTKVMDVGKDNWRREVRILIGPDGPSENIILGETINPPGNWSGTPPHRHEKDNLPQESLHEEIYFFKTDKPQGWGLQRFYSPERDINELIYLQDNSVTFMPWGYHQVAAGPGYTLYYLFFLAGNGNDLKAFEDRDHNWIKGK